MVNKVSVWLCSQRTTMHVTLTVASPSRKPEREQESVLFPVQKHTGSHQAVSCNSKQHPVFTRDASFVTPN